MTKQELIAGIKLYLGPITDSPYYNRPSKEFMEVKLTYTGDYVGDNYTKANYQFFKKYSFAMPQNSIQIDLVDLETAEESELEEFLDNLISLENYPCIDDDRAYEISSEDQEKLIADLSYRELSDLVIDNLSFPIDLVEHIAKDYCQKNEIEYFDLKDFFHELLEQEGDFFDNLNQAIAENSRVEYSGSENPLLYDVKFSPEDIFEFLDPNEAGFKKVTGQAKNGKILTGWIK